MDKPKNPYLDLMDDDEPKKQPARPPSSPAVASSSVAKNQSEQNQILPPDLLKALDVYGVRSPMSSVTAGEPEPVASGVTSSAEQVNPYLELFDDGTSEQSFTSLPSVLSGGVGGAKGIAGRIAEIVTGAPTGAVDEVNALLNPTKAAMSPEMAARMAIEARTPPAPVAPPPAPQSAVPKSSGDAWLKNYANINKPDFTGGVPEAAQTYQRGKPSGKISSQLFKKFGNSPLNIGGFSAQQLLSEDELLTKIRSDLYAHEMQKKAAEAANQQANLRAAQVERQAASTANASKLAGPLATAGKLIGVAGIGAGGYDAYTRFKNEDRPGALVGALGTAASAAAPFVASAGMLPAAGVAAPLYLMAQDRLKHLQNHPEDYRLQEDEYDAMGNRQR
jgi:hypothetical protein